MGFLDSILEDDDVEDRNSNAEPAISSTVVRYTDEEGYDEFFRFYDIVVAYEGKSYVLWLDHATNAVIWLCEEANEGEPACGYEAPADDKTLQAVFEIFKEKFENILHLKIEGQLRHL